MPLPTWDEYVWALYDSFGVEYSDSMTEIMNVKHTKSVKDYQKAFNNVMTRMNLSVEHAIRIFLNNIKPEISNAVRIGNPTSFPHTCYLSRLHEASISAQSKAIKATSEAHIHPILRTSQGRGTTGWTKAGTSTYKPHITANLDSFKKVSLQ